MDCGILLLLVDLSTTLALTRQSTNCRFKSARRHRVWTNTSLGRRKQDGGKSKDSAGVVEPLDTFGELNSCELDVFRF